MISYSISRRSQKSLPHEVLDGSNDSANAIWLNLEQITAENASPLVLKVKAELRGFPELELTSYKNWKVKEIQRRSHDTSRNVECLQANQPLYRR